MRKFGESENIPKKTLQSDINNQLVYIWTQGIEPEQTLCADRPAKNDVIKVVLEFRSLFFYKCSFATSKP